LTDCDPKGEEVSQEDADPDEPGVEDSYGKNRVVNQIMRELMDEEQWDKLSFEKVLARAKKHGVFLNEFTFEIDLFRSGAGNQFAKAIKELSTNKKMHARFDELADDPRSLDPKQFLKDIDSIGKGRVAQRLASIFLANKCDVCPPYIKAAFDYLKEKLA